MQETLTPGTRSRIVLLAGVALGIAWYAGGDGLPERLMLAWVIVTLLGALAVLDWLRLVELPARDGALVGGSTALLLVAHVWRDSEILTAVNIMALLGLVVLRAPGRERQGTVLASGVIDLGVRGVRTVAGVLGGALGALGSFDIRGAGWVPQWSVGLGVVLVSPLLVVFAVLLSSADPLMATLFTSVVQWDVPPGLERLVPIGLCAWAATGLLWALCGRSAPARDRRPGPRTAPGVLPARTVVSGLTALAALFAIFLLLQARFLVGGREFVLGSDLTFAEHARRGFFELVAVSAMMMPVLLGADWLADQRAGHDRRAMRLVLRVLLVLLGGIACSAIMRMVVYSSEFGLTELRVYTTAFMGWVGLMFAWFGATVLRGRRSRFVPGALGSAFVVLLALNLLNPAAWIVRVNVARAIAGSPLDVRHIAQLGGGAVPAALASLGRLAPAERCALAGALHDRWVARSAPEWTVDGRLAAARAPEVSAARAACMEDAGENRDS